MEKIDKIERLRNYMSPIINYFDCISQLENAKLPIHKIILNKIQKHNLEVINDVLPKITHLLKAENETGVSDSPSTNGDLPLVRKSECEAVATTTVIGEDEHGTLENRIGFGSLCPDCNSPYIMFTPDHYFECTSCDYTWT
uniref:hypothetical protein n=1 Tax=Roseivirga sp. TaxID=1964215 RepID=UPI0040481670